MYRLTIFLAVAVAFVVGAGQIEVMQPDEIAKTPEIELGITKGVELLNAKNGRNENRYRLVHQSIKRVSKQIVAGTLYRAEIALVASTCKNTEDNASKGIDECPAAGNGVAMYCKLRIWSRPWLKDEDKQLIVSPAIHCTRNTSF